MKVIYLLHFAFLFVHTSVMAQETSGLKDNVVPPSSTGILKTDFFLTPDNLNKDGDSNWYKNNIPFFDCPDEDGGKNIRQIYYYRWRIIKDHAMATENGYTFSEFIKGDTWRATDGYLKKSYSAINAAAGHVINEIKWLKDSRHVQDYINFFLEGDGRLIEYSDWIADAAYSYYLLSGDTAYIISQLRPFINLWNIRQKKYFDAATGLFWLTPQEDAMENNATAYKYQNNFEQTYRPSVNSYAYALAKTIEKTARLSGDSTTADIFCKKAQSVKAAMLQSLWSTKHSFFMEKIKRDSLYAPAREIIGVIPWYFNIPDDTPAYIKAWDSITDSEGGFKGDYGIRTLEKGSAYYLYQYEPNTCQWNGPSWPFTSAFTLTAMANVLNNYQHQGNVTKKLYYDELKKYTLQQYKNGVPYIAESFHPDKNKWSCDIDERSEHYLHSSYNDLVISGLIGIRLNEGNELIINPQIPDTWNRFCLEDIPYRGRQITVVYDVRGDGSRYRLHQKDEVRAGLSVFVDGVLTAYTAQMHRLAVKITPYILPVKKHLVNFASSTYPFEGYSDGYPKITASYIQGELNPHTKENIYAAINSKVFYYPQPANRFTFTGTPHHSDDVIIDFGTSKRVHQINLFLYEDSGTVKPPKAYHIQYATATHPDIFKEIKEIVKTPIHPEGNTVNRIAFEQVDARKIKIVFEHNGNTQTGIANIHALGYKYPTYHPSKLFINHPSKIKKDKPVSSVGKGKIPVIAFNNIHIPQKGYYTLHIDYVNSSGSVLHQRFLVNNKEYEIALPETREGSTFQSIQQNIFLHKGTQSIQFIENENLNISNIAVVEMSSYEDDFADNRPVTDARGWMPQSGMWSVNKGRYIADKADTSFTLLSYRFNGNYSNYTNVAFSSNVVIHDTAGGAGLIFRVSGRGALRKGYYAGINAAGKKLILTKFDGRTTQTLSSFPINCNPNTNYRITVITKNNSIQVFFNNAAQAQIRVIDSQFQHGAVGLSAFNTGAAFSFVSVNECYKD